MLCILMSIQKHTCWLQVGLQHQGIPRLKRQKQNQTAIFNSGGKKKCCFNCQRFFGCGGCSRYIYGVLRVLTWKWKQSYIYMYIYIFTFIFILIHIYIEYACTIYVYAFLLSLSLSICRWFYGAKAPLQNWGFCRDFHCHKASIKPRLVGCKNMKVSWDEYSQYMDK